MLITLIFEETIKLNNMEYALNEYTYRECCKQEIRACDGCDCYECKSCGELNYEECSPLDEEVCFECFLVEKDAREEARKYGES